MTSQSSSKPLNVSDVVATEPSSESQRQHPFQPRAASIFAVPPSIKRLFDQFPLVTYPANALPARSPARRENHAFYSFTTPEGARTNAPSFNPGCLKWQTYLCFCNIRYIPIPSNNHASPSGALPFIIPVANIGHKPNQALPIPSNKLQQWAVNNSGDASLHTTPSSSRQDAYLSMIDRPIRRAWLHSLYLTANLHRLAAQYYIHSITTSSLVRDSLTRDLQLAALKEVRNSSQTSPLGSSSLVTTTLSVLETEELYQEAAEAFEAFAILLGKNEWFFGESKPGIVDAALFAYTHLLLLGGDGKSNGQDGGSSRRKGGSWEWADKRLRDTLARNEKTTNLVRHRERVLAKYYQPGATI